MPRSGVAPLHNGVVAGLDDRQLAKVVLELLGLKCGFLSLVLLERHLVRRMEGFLGWVFWVIGLVESLVLAR